MGAGLLFGYVSSEADRLTQKTINWHWRGGTVETKSWPWCLHGWQLATSSAKEGPWDASSPGPAAITRTFFAISPKTCHVYNTQWSPGYFPHMTSCGDAEEPRPNIQHQGAPVVPRGPLCSPRSLASPWAREELSILHIGVDKPAGKGEEWAFTVAVHAEHPQVILPCGTSLASYTDTVGK